MSPRKRLIVSLGIPFGFVTKCSPQSLSFVFSMWLIASYNHALVFDHTESGFAYFFCYIPAPCFLQHFHKDVLKPNLTVGLCHRPTLYVCFGTQREEKETGHTKVSGHTKVYNLQSIIWPRIPPLLPSLFPSATKGYISCAMLRCMIVSSSIDYVAIYLYMLCCAATLCRVVSCSATTRCAATHDPSPSTKEKKNISLCFAPPALLFHQRANPQGLWEDCPFYFFEQHPSPFDYI